MPFCHRVNRAKAVEGTIKKQLMSTAFKMKGPRKILWVFVDSKENKAGVKRKLLDAVKQRKLAYNRERDSARNNAMCM